MRKWRPTHKCIYVIPEVRGNVDSLEVILNRILPLRIFKNQEDVLVMLGDYIDNDESSDKVIDALINIKEEYKDRVIFIKGDHEEMLLRSRISDQDFDYWIDNGGIATIASYLKRSNLDASPYSIKRNRLTDLIPKSHFEFLSNLENYFILDDYCFFHGGFNHEKSIEENNINNFPFDMTSSKYVKESLKHKKDISFKDNYVFVGNNNYMSDKPFVYQRYFMMGANAPAKLFVFDLNSVSACAITKGKTRIYKHNFNVIEG